MIATMRNLGMVAGTLLASSSGPTGMTAVGLDSGPRLRAAFMSALALAFRATGLRLRKVKARQRKPPGSPKQKERNRLCL